MQKYVLQLDGQKIRWQTAHAERHGAIRLALRYFGIPDDKIMASDTSVCNLWEEFRKRQDGWPQIVIATSSRGDGKTIPNPGEDRKIIGWNVNSTKAPLDRRGAVLRALDILGIKLPGSITEATLETVFKEVLEARGLREDQYISPVYEEPKSLYVTRQSAENALLAARIGGKEYGELLDMLEDKPKERVKAGTAA